jgi:hypothetical protein
LFVVIVVVFLFVVVVVVVLPDSVFCRTIFICLMIDEDEDDTSYVAMMLYFGVRLTCQGHTPSF